MPYRKEIHGKNVWHWCKNCSNWPEADYEKRPEKPYWGELCNECRNLEQQGQCEK
jgi:hypothetical protein